jgi:DNA-binding transcriptional ArsR family regulator
MSTLKLGNEVVNLLDAKKAQNVFRALNHKLRISILETIEGSGNKMPVTDLYVKLRLEQSVASQHLAILRKAKLVTTQREGKWIFYSVNHPMLVVIGQVSETLLKSL